jgi:hypothetical protein
MHVACQVEFLLKLVNELRQANPKIVPQVILVDGNGILHHRGLFQLPSARFLNMHVQDSARRAILACWPTSPRLALPRSCCTSTDSIRM